MSTSSLRQSRERSCAPRDGSFASTLERGIMLSRIESASLVCMAAVGRHAQPETPMAKAMEWIRVASPCLPPSGVPSPPYSYPVELIHIPYLVVPTNNFTRSVEYLLGTLSW